MSFGGRRSGEEGFKSREQLELSQSISAPQPSHRNVIRSLNFTKDVVSRIVAYYFSWIGLEAGIYGVGGPTPPPSRCSPPTCFG